MTVAAQKQLGGVMVALITPFTDDGKHIDEQRLKSHIDRMCDAGIHGLVPGGSTGEFPVLSNSERKQLIESTVKYAAGRVPVIAGVGALSSEEVIDLAAHAADTGAAALMIVPPFYDAVNVEQLEELLSEVYQVCKLPIVYYNIPSASGLSLSPRQLANLTKVGVKYLKDTSGNGPALTELLFGLHEEITAFNGWDTLTFYGLAAGAKGTIWGATNFIPELSAELWDALSVKGDLKRGRELWSKIWPICAFLERHNYSAAVKTAIELLGHKTGGVRKPFKLLEGKPRQELAMLLRNAGLKVME